jgi:hypothetical protein
MSGSTYRWVLMPAASMFAPTVSPSSVFEAEPESPGEIAPKNMKCVAPQCSAVADRGVPAGKPTPVPCP